MTSVSSAVLITVARMPIDWTSPTSPDAQEAAAPPAPNTRAKIASTWPR
jgi:hypothetical protein